MSDIPVWQRQEGEPTLWYDRFEKYFLVLGPARNLSKAYQAFLAIENPPLLTDEDDGPIEIITPGTWSSAAEKYNWVERAEAFDAKFFSAGGAQDLAREKLQGLTLKAVQTLEIFLNHPRLGVAAAKEILDRGGLPATSAHLVAHTTITADEMAAAKEEIKAWEQQRTDESGSNANKALPTS